MKTKSSVPATTKALQAWQSELRRLEKRLVEWEHALGEREENLEKQEAAFEAAVDGANEETIKMYADKFKPDIFNHEDCHSTQDHYGDCGCTVEDAEDGCDCPKCAGLRDQGADRTQYQEKVAIDQLKSAAAKGDSVQWLESLWKLEDKRKKKK